MNATALPASDGRMPVLRARAPQPLLDALDRAAALTGQSRSAALRELLTGALGDRGLWPPQGGERV